MKTAPLACVLLPTALLTGCSSPGHVNDPLGQRLVAVEGESLAGEVLSLPADLAGRPAVLLVGYEQEAQFDADRWLFGLLQSETPARLLELPTIPGFFGSLLGGTIDRGMRSGIPEEDWPAVVTLYGESAERLADFTGQDSGRNMHVLVLDADGVVRWHHARGFSAAKLLELDTLVRSWSEPAGEEQAPAAATPPVNSAAVTNTAPWPQWRGPTRDGRVEGEPWPEELSLANLTELWQIEGLGPSYSGPIVSAELAFTTETLEDEEEEVVRAFERATGKERWSTRWSGAMEVPFFAAKNGSWIRSTPAWDGEALYVGGMRDVLVCLAGADGSVRWRVDFPAQGHEEPAFGFVSSPLVHGEHVYVQAGGALVCLARSTGALVWRALEDGGGNDSAFSSPLLATLAGKEQLVVQTRADLCGIDPASGSVLWRQPIPSFRGMNILTPSVVGDALFTASYGGGSRLLRVARGSSGLTVETTWTAGEQGYMTSPVLSPSHAYLFLRSNRFGCIDLASGEANWISEPSGDEYWSLASQGDRILALADTGVLRLLRMNPERYELLGEVELVAGPSWAHLAVAGAELHVREQDSYRVFSWGPRQL
ncbi:MAG: PQQ-binding-like beta-propeller repeat protein [Planctomycetota bacterium]